LLFRGGHPPPPPPLIGAGPLFELSESATVYDTLDKGENTDYSWDVYAFRFLSITSTLKRAQINVPLIEKLLLYSFKFLDTISLQNKEQTEKLRS
jgi:hypothetical protein